MKEWRKTDGGRERENIQRWFSCESGAERNIFSKIILGRWDFFHVRSHPGYCASMTCGRCRRDYHSVLLSDTGRNLALSMCSASWPPSGPSDETQQGASFPGQECWQKPWDSSRNNFPRLIFTSLGLSLSCAFGVGLFFIIISFLLQPQFWIFLSFRPYVHEWIREWEKDATSSNFIIWHKESSLHSPGGVISISDLSVNNVDYKSLLFINNLDIILHLSTNPVISVFPSCKPLFHLSVRLSATVGIMLPHAWLYRLLWDG